MPVNPASIANLVPLKPGQILNPGGRAKVDPEILRAAREAFEKLTPAAVAYHANIIAMAERAFKRCAPTAENPNGEMPSKSEAQVIATAEKSAECVLNRVLGKVESIVKHSSDSGADAFVRAFRAMIGGAVAAVNAVNNGTVLDAEIVPSSSLTNGVLNAETVAGAVVPIPDIGVGGNEKAPCPPPNPQ